MTATTYQDLKVHLNHHIVCTYYGVDSSNPESVTLECVSCGEVLMDFNKPEEEISDESSVSERSKPQAVRDSSKRHGRVARR